MKVLVTGGCGFIGSHTCEFFRQQGWDVVAFDNMTKAELHRTQYQADAARDHIWDLLGEWGVQRVRGDVRNLDEVLDAASGCDFIVHTAAQPAMTIAIEDPILDCSTNVLGTVNVLEAARLRSIPIVSCATIHVYGNWINNHLREADTRFISDPATLDESAPTMQGNLTPLHASKAAAEMYLQIYVQTYGIRAGSFRLTGLYGPRQFGGEDHGWVANFTIRNAIGWPMSIYGTGKQVRDILFATDVPKAFYAFFQRGQSGVYNIGGGPAHSISLIECIRLIDEITGRTSTVTFGPERQGDLRYFVCDVGKARTELGWSPQVAPPEGVAQLAAWVDANRGLFVS